MRIGYVNPEYNTRRNIIGKCAGCEYVRIHSFKLCFDRVGEKLGLLGPGLQPYLFWGGFPEHGKRVDILHFFDNIAIPPCRKPYVTTFETVVPRAFRQGRMMHQGIESLLSNQCRRLIALSEHAKRRQMAFDVKNEIEELDKKITVILSPQETLVREAELLGKMERTFQKHCAPWRLLFVGKDFFRKGGAEIVRALLTVHKELPVEAFLVGDYGHVDYASSWEVDSADEMSRLFSENSEWLHHFKAMPNEAVLTLAKTCHIGLLPTRDDTFGYSVLEFQSCGLPCITTDIRALPEVNNDGIGWLVNVPQLSNGCADYSTTEKMRELSRAIENGLVEKLREALSKPETLFQKGVNALTNVSRNHSPEEYGKRLGEIYRESME